MLRALIVRQLNPLMISLTCRCSTFVLGQRFIQAVCKIGYSTAITILEMNRSKSPKFFQLLSKNCILPSTLKNGLRGGLKNTFDNRNVQP